MRHSTSAATSAILPESPASAPAETSDEGLMDVLRRQEDLGIAELAEATGVTATAVRQRLTRLMAAGLVQRKAERPEKQSRGRPGHKYSLTEKGIRQAGNNYGDLAVVLWEEIRSVKDPEVRRGLLQRLVSRMADSYQPLVEGETLDERMRSLTHLMGERQVPFATENRNELPVLTALACPYPDLAAQDHSICALERMLFSEVLGSPLKLTECRLDGGTCCTFEAS